MEHLRKVYKRQWFESYRINADEYLSVYSKTKAAQYQAWQEEIIKEEKMRREKMWRMEASKQLSKKQAEIWSEYSEKKFFYWYEKASERLQQMNRMKWITRDNLSEHIERELDKYTIDSKKENNDPVGYRGVRNDTSSSKKFPLNFVGQMPLLEDETGNIVSVPLHSKQYYDLNTKRSDKADAQRSHKQFAEKVDVYDPGESKFLDDISTDATRLHVETPGTESVSQGTENAMPSVKPQKHAIPVVEEADRNEEIGLEKITKFEHESIKLGKDGKKVKDHHGGPTVKPLFR